MLRKVTLFLSLCVFSNISRGQEQNALCSLTLKGQIVNSDTGEPVPGALVKVSGTEKNVISDTKGEYQLSDLCRGQLSLIITCIGFEQHVHKLSLNAARSLKISLHPENIELKEVEVKGHKKSVNTPNISESIDGTDLERTRGASLASSIQKIAGVSMLQTGGTIAKPVIHGLHSNRVLILNNGIRQEGQQWGAEHAPEIDPFVAQRITVIKGSEGIRYGGDAIAGVILVEPAPLGYHKPVNAELNIGAALNGRSGTSSARVDGSFNDLAWRLQGTLKRAGDLKTAAYFLDNTGVRELNFSGALGFSRKNFDTELYYSRFNTDLGILKDAHIGNINDLIARINHGRPFFDQGFSYTIDAPMQKISHDLLKWKGHVHLGNALHLNTVYAFQNNNRQEYDQRRVLSGTPTLFLKLQTHTLDLNIEHMSASGWRKIAGVSYINQVNNNVAGTGVTPLIPNYDSYTASVYGIVRRLRASWETEAGVRYDYKSLDALGYNRNKELYGGKRTFNNISASLGAVKHFSSHWHLRSNAGLAWRPPTVNELYSNGLHHGTASFEIGDSTLAGEKSLKWITSLQHQGGRLSFTWDVYVNAIHDFIYLQPAGRYFENIRGAFPIYEYRQTNARLLGTDVSGSYHISSLLDYSLKLSIIRGRDTKNDSWLPWMPADRLSNSVRFNLPHGKNLSESYLELSHQFTDRQRKYEPNSDFAAPPAGYHLFGISAGTRLLVNKQHLGINMTADNLFNKLYKDYLNRFRYFSHDPGRNITLRINWKF